MIVSVTAARAAYTLARAVDYFGTAVFLGGLAFLVLVWPAGAATKGGRRLVVLGWVLGFVGTVAAIGLQGVWVTGRPITDAVRVDLVSLVLELRFGEIWFAKAMLWLLAGVVLADVLRRRESAVRSVAWRVGAGAVGLGLLRLTGMTGHTVDAPNTLVAEVADLVHQTGITVWIGGLVMLLAGVLPRRRADELAIVTPRYSMLAAGSVLVIVLSGVVLTWQIVGSVPALFDTDHGQLLLVKLFLLGAVLTAAFFSRNWVLRRLDFAVVLRGDVATVRPFVYSVTAETVLVVFVLLAASLLVTANPGQ